MSETLTHCSEGIVNDERTADQPPIGSGCSHVAGMSHLRKSFEIGYTGRSASVTEIALERKVHLYFGLPIDSKTVR
jgi:hypothetical protein